MNQQLTLGIRLRDDATFENYFCGENQQVIHSLQIQTEPYVFLYGSKGSGKSHLLQAACHEKGKAGLPVVYLPLAEAGMVPGMLVGLEAMALIALDDIQSVVSNDEWELALFNLYNRVREKGGAMLVSSDQPLASLNIMLNDLRSRLSWGPVFQLNTLSDSEKQQALQQRAMRRGLSLSDDVVAYLLKRSPRDMHSLFTLFDKLDHASMVEKRKLTIPFIKDYL